MAAKRSRYREMERFMCTILLVDLIVFILFLVFSALGILVPKVIAAILAITVSCFSLYFLYRNGELTRPRSIWLTLAYFGIALCTVVSVIANYPSPKP